MSKKTFTGIDNAYLDVILGCHQRAVTIALAMACRHNGKNNGSIPFSIREGMSASRSTHRLVRAALDELVDKGLIECTKKASFDNKAGARGRQAREWKLNFVWEKSK